MDRQLALKCQWTRNVYNTRVVYCYQIVTEKHGQCKLKSLPPQGIWESIDHLGPPGPRPWKEFLKGTLKFSSMLITKESVTGHGHSPVQKIRELQKVNQLCINHNYKHSIFHSPYPTATSLKRQWTYDLRPLFHKWGLTMKYPPPIFRTCIVSRELYLKTKSWVERKSMARWRRKKKWNHASDTVNLYPFFFHTEIARIGDDFKCSSIYGAGAYIHDDLQCLILRALQWSTIISELGGSS